MTTEGFKRRLSAILSADVKEYSRLMRDDEDATIRTLTTYRSAIAKLVQQYRGRVVDSPGDNVLAEFGSVVDAVNCAVEIQRDLAERNAEPPYHRRMEFRIGVNSGDVVEEGERIYGDGVNIAARVEGLAEGGGICISGTVYDSIEGKLGLEFEYLGEHEVKNIDKPIRVYRVLSFPGAAAHRVVQAKEKEGRKWRKAAMAVALVLIVGAAAVAVWNFYLRPSIPPVEPASVEKMAFPLPEKPSIAVLPFKNLSGESEQEFLADGITESIIGTISRVSGLFVIASNSVFTYKGKPVKVQTVSEELGVRNVLEGTVQRIGNQLRVNAQLIDATTGRHVWSEKYDREMKDIFSVQDDISKEILTALRVKLVEGEQARVWARGTNNLEAYLKFLKAYDHFKSFNKNSMILTRQVCGEAITVDGKYDAPYSLLGCSHLIDLWFHWGESPRSSIEKAEAALQKAVALNPLSDYAYANLGHLYLMQERHDESVEAGEKAISLNPNGDYNMILLGITFNYVRRYKEAITLFKEGQRRNPYCPAWYIHNMGGSYRGLGRWDEAIVECKRALDRKPDHFPALAVMASVYGMAGRLVEGRTVAEKMLKMNPKYSIEASANWPFKHKSDAEAVRDGLRKVGIPETPPLPLPDKPSIAVLPFTNISGDPEQELFSDGLAENIITQLAKIPEMLVIARNSSFMYKGKSVNVQQVGRELGVRYVLEGSVLQAENQLRITAQLVDTKTGVHLWAQEYDRELQNFFQVQDEITLKVVNALQVKLTEGGKDYVLKSRTSNLKAWAAFMNCFKYWEKFTKEDNERAKEFAEQAIALDPDYSSAYGGMAWVYLIEYRMGWGKEPERSLRLAEEFAKKSIAKDETNPLGHAALGQIYGHQKKFDQATSKAEQAFELAPNDPNLVIMLTKSRYWLGKYEEGLNMAKKAIRLRPFPPPYFTEKLVEGYYLTGQYERASAIAKSVLKQYPMAQGIRRWLIPTYVELGQEREAREEAQRFLEISPQFSVKTWADRKFSPYKDQKIKARILEQFAKAGLK